MDTDSFVLSFTPFNCLFNVKKHFSDDADLIEIDPMYEQYSKDNIKVIDKKNFRTFSPETEIDEAAFLRINFILWKNHRNQLNKT